MSEELKQKLLALAARWESYESYSTAFSDYESGLLSGYETAKQSCGEELRELLEETK